jgi:hypothetical protein
MTPTSLITLCCELRGGHDAVDMPLVARQGSQVCATFSPLSDGTPGHDAFIRTFHHLDPDQFRDLFQRFTVQLSEHLKKGLGYRRQGFAPFI